MTGSALLRGAGLVAALAVALPAPATKITIVNVDTPGVGFNDQTIVSPVGGNTATTLGEQRLNVFRYAAAFWEKQIDSPVEIFVRASFSRLNCSTTTATLGSAGGRYIFSDFQGAPRKDTWYSEALANKLAGQDLNPPCTAGQVPPCGEPETGEDVQARFTTALDDGSCSFSRKWYYGLDAQPPAQSIDFASVVIHELGHGLGFQTFVNGQTGALIKNDAGVGLFDPFMLNLLDASTGKTWDQMTDAERVAAAVAGSNLVWNGTAVTAVTGTALVQGTGAGGRALMYAPNPYEPGSSVSHWDTSLFPNEMMEPNYTVAKHELGITDEAMRDLGWGLASGSVEYHWLLPSSARAPGQGGAFYSTALSIGNRGSAEARFRLKFLGNNADGTGGPVSSEFVLGPNQSVTYDDVLGSVFNKTADYGAIRLTANVATLNVVGQTATPDPSKPGGTFGQSVPAFSPADLLSGGNARSIVGIRQDGSFRTNLVLANAGTSPVTVNGTLFSASGAVLGTGQWTLPPLGMTQVSGLVGAVGASGNVRDAQILLSTSTSGGAFAAYAVVIDNVTNDPRTLLPK